MSNTIRPRPRQYRELSVSRMLMLLVRGITLRCPHCGRSFLLQTWFRLKPKCDNCRMRTDRGEEDFFLGGMMWNLVFAEGVLVISALLVGIATWPDVPWTLLQWGSIALMVIAPIFFYPFSLCFWLACDIWFRPVTPEEMDWHRASDAGEFREHKHR